MTEYAFPEGFAEVYKAHFRDNLLDFDGSPITSIVGRTTRIEDPSSTVGILADIWSPVGYQIGQIDPAIQKYSIEIWNMSKHASEELGRASHSGLSRNIRRMVAGDRELRSTLMQLTDTYEGTIERPSKIQVLSQKFWNNEARSQHVFLSVTTVEIETEIA